MTKLTAALLFAACGTTDGEPGPGDGDGPCASEQLRMSGAFAVSTPSASTFLIEDKIIGIAGYSSDASGAYAFTFLNALDDSFLQVGTYDIAGRPMKYLEGIAEDNCTDAEPCVGFIAQAGTVEVLSLDPFQATFTLSDLYEADTSANDLGPPIDGNVTGCLYSAN